MYFGAKMDDELFAFMTQADAREHLRMVLINTYFTPKIHPLLIRLGKVNLEAYAYCQGLLSGVRETQGHYLKHGGTSLLPCGHFMSQDPQTQSHH